MNKLEQQLEWWIHCGTKQLNDSEVELNRYKQQLSQHPEDLYVKDSIKDFTALVRSDKRWLLWVLEMCLDYHLESINNPFKLDDDFKPWYCTCIPEKDSFGNNTCTCPSSCGRCKKSFKTNQLYWYNQPYNKVCKNCKTLLDDWYRNDWINSPG